MALLKEDGSLDIERINSLPNDTRLLEHFVRKVIKEVKRRIINEGHYKVIGFDEDFDYGNGVKGHALLTLSDGYGLIRVIEDDHCYVAYKKVGNEYMKQTHLFPELFNAMVDYLPKLPPR